MFAVTALVVMAVIGRVAGDVLLLLVTVPVVSSLSAAAKHLVEEAELCRYGACKEDGL